MKFKKVKSPIIKNISLEIKDFTKGLNTFTHENILQSDVGVNCYNFSYSNGALTSGVGFKYLEIDYSKAIDDKTPLPFPSDLNFKKAWQFKHWDTANLMRRDKLMVWASDNNIYYVPLFSTNPMLNETLMQFSEEPEQLNYKLNGEDFNICVSTSDAMQIWDGANNPYTYTTGPDIRSFCALNGKFYATFGGDRNVIRYTSNEDLTTWYVALEGDDKEIVLKDNLGRINKVVSHLNYVYAFRDFGITKISRSANSVNTSNLFCTGNVIYDKTIAICGNEIYFLSRDGIYNFDGSNVKKLDLRIDGLLDGLDNKNAVACFHNGYYYVALKMNFKDDKVLGCESGEFKNNTLLKISTSGECAQIVRGVDICSLSSIQFDRIEKVVVCFNSVYNQSIAQITNDGLLFGNPMERKWVSPLSDLGYSETIKCVKDLCLDCESECSVKIFSESEEKTINVNPQNKVMKYRVNIKGKKIGVEILANSNNANVSNLKLNIDLLEGKTC